jgi:hypothetical protein
MNKLEIYLEELERDNLKKIKSTGQVRDEDHYCAIEVLKVIIKIKDILDEQK